MNSHQQAPPDLSTLVNLFDLEPLAAARMTTMAYEYVASGAADEFTVRWNRQAFDAIRLNPRVLVDVSQLDTRLSLFGQELPYPILIAPTAFHKIMHPDGELATARGAGAASATYVISSFTTTPLDDIARVASGPLWFQLYMSNDRAYTRDLIQHAEAQGCRALCVTVDTPVLGARNRQQRVGFALPDGITTPLMPNAMAPSTSLTWHDVAWLKSVANVPILLKGILNPDDAELAVQAGVAGIIVSNHSGRNLDTVPATIDALPRITERVAGRIPILLDGGIRRGTDVLKAIALGASAVLVGKPICFGLAYGGAAGVTKVLDILRDELELAMALTGRATLADIDESVIWRSNR
ncbi:alpha-hydroxy-acid oxidizing protein [Fibrella sp. HMF5335]|uniref:Alpha-hydroxy-acid oxidizing protein n=1 Tax=Fibrella rubiginis TaxID=2817060 RepID=A0A939GJM6_9BACT|nr:alpha-hydroxy acid oxidase [Fibrella rubiginis]MBO0938474.1 alpha-hydroxy-acid oxidizing protein [Fibrella rubiginis]